MILQIVTRLSEELSASIFRVPPCSTLKVEVVGCWENVVVKRHILETAMSIVSAVRTSHLTLNLVYFNFLLLPMKIAGGNAVVTSCWTMEWGRVNRL
jgi:hypothetical protein